MARRQREPCRTTIQFRAGEAPDTSAPRGLGAYKAMMKWMALLSMAWALLSIVYLKQGGRALPIPAVIGGARGRGAHHMIATGLMGLVFLSNRSGHDEEANRRMERRVTER